MADRSYLRSTAPEFRGVIATAVEWRVALASWSTAYLLQCRLDADFWETVCWCPTASLLLMETALACGSDHDELADAIRMLPDYPADCRLSDHAA